MESIEPVTSSLGLSFGENFQTIVLWTRKFLFRYLIENEGFLPEDAFKGKRTAEWLMI